MLVIAATTVGLVVWIVCYSIGVKSFDAFMLGLLFVLPAAAYHVFAPGIKKMLGAEEPPSSSP